MKKVGYVRAQSNKTYIQIGVGHQNDILCCHRSKQYVGFMDQFLSIPAGDEAINGLTRKAEKHLITKNVKLLVHLVIVMLTIKSGGRSLCLWALSPGGSLFYL